MDLNIDINKLNVIFPDTNFCLKNLKGNVIYIQPKVKNIIQNMALFKDNIYIYNDIYFEKKTQEIVIDDIHYIVELYVDVTKYYKQINELNDNIVYLKKENTCLKIDDITNLPIRGELNKYIKKIKRIKLPKTFVMCDIDNFKTINDTYGHDVGDIVLNRIGLSLLNNVRKEDFVGRYGGEEFLIIFNTDKIDKILNRLNSIKDFLKNDPILKEKGLENITFSAGISVYQPRSDVENVVKRADEAVYYVKKNGKNGVAMYNQEFDKCIMI